MNKNLIFSLKSSFYLKKIQMKPFLKDDESHHLMIIQNIYA